MQYQSLFQVPWYPLCVVLLLAFVVYAIDLIKRWKAPKAGTLRRFPFSGLSGFLTRALLFVGFAAWLTSFIPAWLFLLLEIGMPLILNSVGEKLFHIKSAKMNQIVM